MSRQPGTYAVFNTSEGNIVARLFEKDAPKTVANFVELAEGKREWTHPVSNKKSSEQLYNGTIFHRVIPDFMIQGGPASAVRATNSRTKQKVHRTDLARPASWRWPMPDRTQTAHSSLLQLRRRIG
jgi:cyclophilin family peptidyl-prolyl cis-trans isomerase